MSHRRPSKSLINAKLDALARAKAQQDKYRILSEGKESPFWKEIDRRIKAKSEEVETRLDEYMDMPDRAIWACLEQRKMYRFFGALVEESDSALEAIGKRIGVLEKEIADARKGIRE